MQRPQQGPSFMLARAAARGGRTGVDPIDTPTRTTGEGSDDLAARLRAGDARALEALYDRVGRRAFGLAYRILGDGASAEDAVQEAFVALWQQADRLDAARGRVDSLLLTIVHRRAIDIVRRRRGQATTTLDAGDELADGRATALLDAATDAVMHAQVVTVMAALPEDQRVAIELAYFEGITQVEIAARTGAPLGTVKSRLRLGLEHIRSSLGIGGEA